MDDTRRSRFEIALKKQDLSKRYFEDDETNARRREAKSQQPGNCHWPSTLDTSHSRFCCRYSQPVGFLRLLVRHRASSIKAWCWAALEHRLTASVSPIASLRQRFLGWLGPVPSSPLPCKGIPGGTGPLRFGVRVNLEGHFEISGEA